MKAKEVTVKQLKNIISEYMPLGIFYAQKGNVFIGVDNRSGEAYTEEFNNKKQCIEWLESEREYYTELYFGKTWEEIENA